MTNVIHRWFITAKRHHTWNVSINRQHCRKPCLRSITISMARMKRNCLINVTYITKQWQHPRCEMPIYSDIKHVRRRGSHRRNSRNNVLKLKHDKLHVPGQAPAILYGIGFSGRPHRHVNKLCPLQTSQHLPRRTGCMPPTCRCSVLLHRRCHQCSVVL